MHYSGNTIVPKNANDIVSIINRISEKNIINRVVPKINIL